MDVFGDLRSILQEPASHSSWERLIELLGEAGELDQLSPTTLSYLEEHLASWPDSLRPFSPRWIECMERGETLPSSCSLARSLRLDEDTLGPEARLYRTYLHSTTRLNRRLMRILLHPSLTHLRTLTLALSAHGGDELARHLVRRKTWESLEQLTLSGCGLTDRGAMTLAASSSFPHLRHLDLRQNPLGAASLDALQRAETLPSLETITHDDESSMSRE